MLTRKKILSFLLKLLIGIGSFFIIYLRLKSECTPENLDTLYSTAFSALGLSSFVLCLLLIPVNWGIEAYKWKLITAPVQQVSYKTATKSIYAGICLGNLAPGRATEFLAKIIFFKIENRPKITVLHFVGGMFQLSITIICGFMALFSILKSLGRDSALITGAILVTGVILLTILVLSVYNINSILNFISKKISRKKHVEDFNYKFTSVTLIKLFSFSAMRYTVFFLQFALLLFLFNGRIHVSVFPQIALYFLVTATIPMISVLEAAIRTAVALIVFQSSELSDSALALSTVLLWMANIIVPSIFGYIVLVRQKFNFKLFKTEK